MQRSLKYFEAVTRLAIFKSVPVVVLLNKLDLFRQKMVEAPIADFFPDYTGGQDCYRAVKFFADEFDRRDSRSNTLRGIYPTSAVDRDTLRQPHC